MFVLTEVIKDVDFLRFRGDNLVLPAFSDDRKLTDDGEDAEITHICQVKNAIWCDGNGDGVGK